MATIYKKSFSLNFYHFFIIIRQFLREETKIKSRRPILFEDCRLFEEINKFVNI